MGSLASRTSSRLAIPASGSHLGNSIRNPDARPRTSRQARDGGEEVLEAEVDAPEQVALPRLAVLERQRMARARRRGRRRRSGRWWRRSPGRRPRATPAIMRPVGVGLRSPSPTGVVGLTTTALASSASRSAASFVRL